jgi:LysR family transcriptional regulator, glycine cleavage system transcriptional activator
LGSFSAAAAELGVTHGAVSKQIHALEAWLGQTLFIRSSHRMMPTREGRAFARELGESFDRMAEAVIRHRTANTKCVLRVNAPATFAMRWLIPRLPLLYEQHSDMEVLVSTTSNLNESIRGTFDLAIRRVPSPSEHCVGTRFLDEADTLIASPALLERRPLHQVSDIAKHTILSTETRPGDWEDWLAVAGYHGAPPLRQYRYDHYFVTLQAAIDAFGLAIGPLPALSEDIERGRLFTPFPEIRVARPSYFVLASTDVRPAKAVQRFIAWLVSVGKAP